MLRKPVLTRCADGTPAQQNNYCGDPESWFSNELFKAKGFNALRFDYIVDWEANRFQDEIWIKRIVCDDTDYSTLKKEDLAKRIVEEDGRSYPRQLLNFANTHNLRLRYFLFRNINQNDWSNLQNRIVSIDLSRYSHSDCVEIYNAETIQSEIIRLRKQSHKIGKKGLIYATSTLEGYLSKSKAIWPGDVDTLLVDTKNNVKAIIEFKKHTSRSKIAFDDQSIENYRDIDVLKYRSLGLLRDRFDTPSTPLLIIIYFSTESEEKEIIMETLAGPYDTLSARETHRLRLPKQGDLDSLNIFCEEFIGATKLSDC